MRIIFLKTTAVNTSHLSLSGVGTSSRCSDTYHGPRPFSEVETYNVAKYLLKQRRNLIGYMDIHAYSQLWMTPWGYKRAHPDDNGEQVGTSIVIVHSSAAICSSKFFLQFLGACWKCGSGCAEKSRLRNSV
jgi:hypothetical protein